MQPQADAASPMHPRPFRVLDTWEEIPGCTTMRVEPSGGTGGCGFAPGQFYMIYVFGHGEVPISVSGDPAKSGGLIFTVMAVGSVTRALCAVKSGDTIGLRGPFGSAWPVDKVKGRDVIVMAGGLGLAPLRPSIYHMLHNRDDYGDLTILYGTRQPQSIVFPEELAGWRDGASVEDWNPPPTPGVFPNVSCPGSGTSPPAIPRRRSGRASRSQKPGRSFLSCLPGSSHTVPVSHCRHRHRRK